MKKWLESLVKDGHAQRKAECILMMGLVTIAVIAAMVALRANIITAMQSMQ